MTETGGHVIKHHIDKALLIETIPKTGPAPAPAGFVPETSPVAVFVAHGMVQQAPFETLDAIAQGLIAAGDGAGAPVAANTVRIGDQKLQRLEFNIRRSISDICIMPEGGSP